MSAKRKETTFLYSTGGSTAKTVEEGHFAMSLSSE